MPNLRIHNVSVSLDGFAAGPDQSLEQPLGVRGEELHEWFVTTAAFRRTFGDASAVASDDDADERLAAAGEVGIGATIMGRNMFGPVRGGWGDSTWTGWWGDEPPYHHPVFVLTHHAHDPIPMAGGTTFHFVTDGIEAALERAFAAAGGSDVRLGGGADTIRQYLRAGLVDEAHFALAPILLGAGERIFEDLAGVADGYRCVELAAGTGALHVRLARVV